MDIDSSVENIEAGFSRALLPRAGPTSRLLLLAKSPTRRKLTSVMCRFPPPRGFGARRFAPPTPDTLPPAAIKETHFTSGPTLHPPTANHVHVHHQAGREEGVGPVRQDHQPDREALLRPQPEGAILFPGWRSDPKAHPANSGPGALAATVDDTSG